MGYITCNKATLSHHMTILMHNRLVKCYKSGRDIYYRINYKELYILANYNYDMFNRAYSSYQAHNSRLVDEINIAKDEIDWAFKRKHRKSK